jgi:hypothetical protein
MSFLLGRILNAILGFGADNMDMKKKICIIGGGTVAHIRNHFAVCAPAYGATAKDIESILYSLGAFQKFEVNVELTKMAGGNYLETNEDVADWVEHVKADPLTKIVFFNAALVDWEPKFVQQYGVNHGIRSTSKNSNSFGKYETRFETRQTRSIDINFTPANKIISNVRKGRKDIFLVGFKATCGATKQEMYEKGLRLCKEGSVNLVLVNDTKTRWNMIVTPEEAAYHESNKRQDVLKNLVEMAVLRSHLTFTQSTVVAGDLVPWSDSRIPESIKKVIDHCIGKNAYKPFNGATVGHFAIKLSDTEFLTSIRRSNFNDLDKNGMVYVKTDGPDTVIAYGAKPSVGGQSQRIVFNDHAGMDCIVHFHSPLKAMPRDDIPVRSQREYECGSHQCGKNTSDGLKQFGNLKAVMLENHGPNIVFNKNINPQEVIDFIESNFELAQKTGGYNLTMEDLKEYNNAI